jgi:hypothetical protein
MFVEMTRRRNHFNCIKESLVHPPKEAESLNFARTTLPARIADI